MKNALVLSLLFAGLVYADGRGAKVVGKWAEANGSDRIEFTADGKFQGIVTYGMAHELRPIVGTYFVVEGDTVAINLTGYFPMIWKVKTLPDGGVIFTYQQGGSVKADRTMAKFKPAK
jgi:hypothetical protein